MKAGRLLCRAPLGVALWFGAGCAQVLGIEETSFEPLVDDDDTATDDDDDTGIVDSGTRPSDDDDDEEDAASPAPEAVPGEDYSCLDRSWLTEAETDEIEIIARIVEITSPTTPVEGMRITVCSGRRDFACQGGVQVLSDASGLARVPVRNGFDGYLRVEGPDAQGTERVSYLWYFSQALTDTYVFPIFSMTPEFRDDVIYGGALGSEITRNPERGEIAINVTDCSDPQPPTQDVGGESIKNAPGQNAPDVHFRLTNESSFDEETRAFYFSDDFPIWPEEEEDQRTDRAGLGGFLNVRRGTARIEAIPTSLGTPSGSDTLLVEAGFLTTVRLLPE